jgi:predicted kinase
LPLVTRMFLLGLLRGPDTTRENVADAPIVALKIAGSRSLRIGADGCDRLGACWIRQEYAGERVGTRIRLGNPIFRSKQGKSLPGSRFINVGGLAARRRLYSKAMTRKTYETLLWNAANRVNDRRSLILDATFSRRHHRDRLRQQLDLIGVTYCFVEAQASEQILKKRLERRGEQLNEESDARLEDFETLNQSYEAPLELEAHHRPLETTVAETLKALMQQQTNRTART